MLILNITICWWYIFIHKKREKKPQTFDLLHKSHTLTSRYFISTCIIARNNNSEKWRVKFSLHFLTIFYINVILPSTILYVEHTNYTQYVQSIARNNLSVLNVWKSMNFLLKFNRIIRLVICKMSIDYM